MTCRRQQKLHRTLLHREATGYISCRTWRPRKFQSFLPSRRCQGGTALRGRCRRLRNSCQRISPDSNPPRSISKRSVSNSPFPAPPRKWFFGQGSIPKSRRRLPSVEAHEDRFHQPRRCMLWTLGSRALKRQVEIILRPTPRPQRFSSGNF